MSNTSEANGALVGVLLQKRRPPLGGVAFLEIETEVIPNKWSSGANCVSCCIETSGQVPHTAHKCSTGLFASEKTPSEQFKPGA